MLPVTNSSSGWGGTWCAHPPLWKFIWLEHARSCVSCHNYREVICATAQLCSEHCFLGLIHCQWVLQPFCPYFQAAIPESWEKQMRHRYPTKGWTFCRLLLPVLWPVTRIHANCHLLQEASHLGELISTNEGDADTSV